MSTLQTKRFRTIQVRLDAAATAGREFSLMDQDDLKDAIIEGIEVFTFTDTPLTDKGAPVVLDGDAVNLALCMVEGSTQKERYIPYFPQRTAINAGVVRRYRDLRPSWPQCVVRVVGDLAATEVSYAYIGVHYRFADDV